jgi:hypothetical protein
MSYYPPHADRRCAVFCYNTVAKTLPQSAQAPTAFQPLDTVLHAGPVAYDGTALTIESGSRSIRGYTFTFWIASPQDTALMLDVVVNMNVSGSINQNNYLSFYSVTDADTYRQDVRSFEETSAFYDGANKSILHITDEQAWARVDRSDVLGWVFESAAGISNDMISPYSRLYGWGGIK